MVAVLGIWIGVPSTAINYTHKYVAMYTYAIGKKYNFANEHSPSRKVFMGSLKYREFIDTDEMICASYYFLKNRNLYTVYECCRNTKRSITYSSQSQQSSTNSFIM